MLLVACGYGSIVLQLVEEALDQVPVAIQERAEGWLADPARDRLDVGPGALSRQAVRSASLS